MPDSIDYDFIAEREGGRRSKGYVPAAGVSKSGVTIATGFDLGARNEGDLSRLGLGKELSAKLKPYMVAVANGFVLRSTGFQPTLE